MMEVLFNICIAFIKQNAKHEHTRIQLPNW
jgi:hypothetical protein